MKLVITFYARLAFNNILVDFRDKAVPKLIVKK